MKNEIIRSKMKKLTEGSSSNYPNNVNTNNNHNNNINNNNNKLNASKPNILPDENRKLNEVGFLNTSNIIATSQETSFLEAQESLVENMNNMKIPNSYNSTVNVNNDRLKSKKNNEHIIAFSNNNPTVCHASRVSCDNTNVNNNLKSKQF